MKTLDTSGRNGCGVRPRFEDADVPGAGSCAIVSILEPGWLACFIIYHRLMVSSRGREMKLMAWRLSTPREARPHLAASRLLRWISAAGQRRGHFT